MRGWRDVAPGYNDPMGSFAKSVMTGFALSLGAALFKKIAPRLGLGEDKAEKDDKVAEKAAGEEASEASGEPVEDAVLA